MRSIGYRCRANDGAVADGGADRGSFGACCAHHYWRWNYWCCCHRDRGGAEMQLVQGRIASIEWCWRHSAAAARCCWWTFAASATAAAADAAVGCDGADVAAGETQ